MSLSYFSPLLTYFFHIFLTLLKTGQRIDKSLLYLSVRQHKIHKIAYNVVMKYQLTVYLASLHVQIVHIEVEIESNIESKSKHKFPNIATRFMVPSNMRLNFVDGHFLEAQRLRKRSARDEASN